MEKTTNEEEYTSIKSNFFDNTDIHIHVPSGAIPKDGPSAGLAITAALISLFTERKVRPAKIDSALLASIKTRALKDRLDPEVLRAWVEQVVLAQSKADHPLHAFGRTVTVSDSSVGAVVKPIADAMRSKAAARSA